MKPSLPAIIRKLRLPIPVWPLLLPGFVLAATIGLAEVDRTSPELDPVVVEVVEMLEAGIDETLIIQWLQSTGSRPADINSQEMIALTESEASEELITTLLGLLEDQRGQVADIDVAVASLPTSNEAAGIRPGPSAEGELREGAVDAVIRLSAKRVWTDEDEPDRPRDPPWHVYLYLDGELLAWTRPSLQGEPVETRRVIEGGCRELRVVLQRYEELRGGWLYESLSVPTLIGFEARPGDPIEIEVDMKRIWGLWRPRKDGGPLSFVIRQGEEVLVENPGTGGDPDRWKPVCEDVEANFADAAKVPARFRNSMSHCVRWLSLWTGVGQTTSRSEMLGELAARDLHPSDR